MKIAVVLMIVHGAVISSLMNIEQLVPVTNWEVGKLRIS